MGYTHYFTQRRDLTRAEWGQISADIALIVKDVQHVQNIPLSDYSHDSGKQPEFTKERISFNGVGEEGGHESFIIRRKRDRDESGKLDGGDFCKTAQKPYDLAVTAVLCYLTTVPDPAAFTASSDGKGFEWLPGLAEAKLALPQYGNVLDIPMGVMQRDRWISPWVHLRTDKYDFKFCVDGFAYALKYRRGNIAASYRMTHKEGAVFFQKNESVLYPSGYFDEFRNRRLEQAQNYLLGQFFEYGKTEPERYINPPAFVRPDAFPEYQEGGKWGVSIADLIAEVTA